MKIGIFLGTVKNILVRAGKGFYHDKVTKLSGSLAYSMIFSMAPLLIVMISFCAVFLGREAIEGKVYAQLASFIGSDTAAQLQEMIRNASLTGKSTIAVTIGIITLLFGATAVFSEIQDSINIIWNIKVKPQKGWWLVIKNRLLSFSVIISLGFLLLVSLVVSSVIEGFSARLIQQFPDTTLIVFYILNNFITLVVTTIIFSVIFKVLPDAKVKWKDVMIGAVITAALFMLGKSGISYYISEMHVGTTYGAAGSLVVLLIWVYYSSIILYFGAELTKAYAIEKGSHIHPNSYAVTVRLTEREMGDVPIRE